MITRIELSNFMSHKRTVIEPAAGLTVLVGPNNCGKSAVVAALQILCHNSNSTYVLRHGERECQVRVTTDDGHTICWKRKNSPSYEIDGQLFDRLRTSGTPDNLHQVLRLPLVEGGDDSDFDVHFGAQKTPIFLLGSSPSVKAKFFASSSDAMKLVEMQRRHKQKLAERQQEKNRLETESKQLNAELEALQPVIEIDHRLKEVEQRHAELNKEGEQIAETARRAAGLEAQQAIVARRQADCAALGALAPPPELAATDTLQALIEDIVRQAKRCDRDAQALAQLAALAPPPELRATSELERLCGELAAAERRGAVQMALGQALETLQAPPAVADAAPCEALLRKLEEATQSMQRAEALQAAAGELSAPPALPEASALVDLIASLAESAAGCQKREQAFAATFAELAAAEEALKELASSSVCPTCGAPLEAQRLLEHARHGGALE